MNPQKGNLYLIIAIIVGVVAIGATGFASWKYFGGGSELEKNGNEITKPLIKKETEKSETIYNLTDKELRIKWDTEKEKIGIDGKIMAIADMDNDGKNDLIIAMPTQSNEEWHDDYITIFSWNNNKFISIWKSADKFSIRDLYVGDVDNNGKNNIIISSSTNFPDYHYFVFEISNASPKNDEWDGILKEAVNKYWKLLKSSSLFDNYWYWKINTIADKNNDNKQELLINVFFLPDDSVPYSELLTLEWNIDDESFYENKDYFKQNEIQTGKFEIDYNEINKIQESVDEGHQPFYLSADMIPLYLGSKYGFDVRDSTWSQKCISRNESKKEIKYEIAYKKNSYIFTVIQPIIGEDKIWIISEIREK